MCVCILVVPTLGYLGLRVYLNHHVPFLLEFISVFLLLPVGTYMAHLLRRFSSSLLLCLSRVLLNMKLLEGTMFP